MRRTFIALCAALALSAAQAQEAIQITFSASTASVSIPASITDVTSSVKGTNVTLTSETEDTEYTYRVKGSCADGSLTITGAYKLTLQLDGIDLTNAHGGAAINVNCGKRIDVELMDGTVNRLADSDKGTQKAAFYFKGHPEIGGGGTLYVTGRLAHAISAKEYMELKRSLGTIVVLGAVKDGLHCGKDVADPEKNYFLMKGGTVNILDVKGDGVDSGDYGSIRIQGGSLSVNVGEGSDGLKADSILAIGGGRVNVAVKGKDAHALRARYRAELTGGVVTVRVEGDGSKGLKGKRVEPGTEGATVTDGGQVCIGGGQLDIQVAGGDLVLSADDTDKCMALSVDADLVQTGGEVTLTALGREARTLNVKGSTTRSGGTMDEVAVPWSVDTEGFEQDMSAFVRVVDGTTPLASYDQKAVGAFIGEECVGYAVFPEATYGLMRIGKPLSAAAGQAVSFSFYDYATGEERALTPSAEVSFTPSSLVGTPDEPVLLSLGQVTAITAITLDDGSLSSSGSLAGSGLPAASPSSGWRTLTGILLPARPTAPGLYLHGGRKVLLR